RAILIHTDRQITFVPGNRELMRNGMPFNGQVTAHRTALDNNGWLFIGSARTKRLYPFGAIAVNSHSLQAQTPAFNVSMLDFFNSHGRWQIHRLRNCPGNEWLHCAHHLEMSHVVDGPHTVRRLK